MACTPTRTFFGNSVSSSPVFVHSLPSWLMDVVTFPPSRSMHSQVERSL